MLVGSGYRGVLRRWQVAVQYDARRRLYATALAEAVERHGEDLGCTQSIVRCASDLEANDFWKSQRYTSKGTELAGVVRRARRHINIWQKALNPLVVATSWANGRPRLYRSNAERQKAYRQRIELRNLPAALQNCRRTDWALRNYTGKRVCPVLTHEKSRIIE